MGDDIFQGKLVRQGFARESVLERIRQPDCDNGFVLDGFPRTLMQSNALDEVLGAEGLFIWKVLVMEVSDMNIIQQRVRGRWEHKASGKVYHIDHSPPQSYKGGEPTAENMLDDGTGEPLQQRESDTVAGLNQQIQSYFSQIEPIITKYEALKDEGRPDLVTRVDASSDLLTVWSRLRNQIH